MKEQVFFCNSITDKQNSTLKMYFPKDPPSLNFLKDTPIPKVQICLRSKPWSNFIRRSTDYFGIINLVWRTIKRARKQIDSIPSFRRKINQYRFNFNQKSIEKNQSCETFKRITGSRNDKQICEKKRLTNFTLISMLQNMKASYTSSKGIRGAQPYNWV